MRGCDLMAGAGVALRHGAATTAAENRHERD